MKKVRTGLILLVLLQAQSFADAARCPNVAGSYRFTSDSCSFQTPQQGNFVSAASAYSLPFPVGRMAKGSSFEIVQNGCSDIQINTKGVHLQAFNYTFTKTTSGMLLYDQKTAERDERNGSIKDTHERFMILPEPRLRVLTSFEEKSGWPPDVVSTSWIKADCKFERVSP